MNEEQIKRLKNFLKEVHGISETQFDKHFATDEASKDAIDTAKSKFSDSYDEGLEDGKTKLKKTIVKSIKEELGIDLKEKDLSKLEEIGKVIKPKVEEKFKIEPSESNDKTIQEWKTKYEEAVAEKDKAITDSQLSLKKEVDSLKRDSIAKDILKAEGYNVPTDSDEYQMKLEMVKSVIEKKGWNYEVDSKDGKFYRMKEDGTKERSNNKAVTFDDDIKGLFNVAFGKNPADQKESGFDKTAGTGAGTGNEKSFDWSAITRKDFAPPTSKDDASKLMQDPLLPLAERVVIRDFIQSVTEQEPAK